MFDSIYFTELEIKIYQVLFTRLDADRKLTTQRSGNDLILISPSSTSLMYVAVIHYHLYMVFISLS
jgi:hypothetical protein